MMDCFEFSEIKDEMEDKDSLFDCLVGGGVIWLWYISVSDIVCSIYTYSC